MAVEVKTWMSVTGKTTSCA